MPLTLTRALAALLMLAGLAACTTPPPAAPKSRLEQDVTSATEALIDDWRARRWLPTFLARILPQPLALGAFNDVAGREAARADFALPQTQASEQARQIVARRLRDYAPEVRLVTAGPSEAAASAASLLVSAQLTPLPAPDARHRLSLLLLDLHSGEVLARSEAMVRSVSADAHPTRFEADSPVLISETPAAAALRKKLFGSPAGTQAADEDEARSVSAAGLLAQAQEAYGDGDFPRALKLFERAAGLPSTHAIRAYNGIYLSHLKLGHTEQARAAFRRVVEEGFAARTLAMKLLFVPGQTEFLADPAVRSAYDSWLQEIATQAAATRQACLDIIGHTSHTGLETFNHELSLARSERVQRLLQGQAPALDRRMAIFGRGWSENIVGSGTDDARDAIDLRVEFKVVDCPR